MSETEFIPENMRIPRQDLEPLDYVAHGVCAVVFKGLWKQSTVAIKMFRNIVSMHNTCSELRLMTHFQHPNICKVLGGCLVSSTELWIILEWIDGGNLWQFLSDNSPLPLHTQLSFALQAASSVNYLHTDPFHLLHRDIKSLNFMVKDKNQLLLIDFGLSKTKEELSNQSHTIGTVRWAAPEVLGKKKKWGVSADIFSLGMVLYELVSGEHPFKDSSTLEAIKKKVKAGDRPKIPQSCPKEFAEIIAKCWNHDPSKRPSSQQLVCMIQELKSTLCNKILHTAAAEGNMSQVQELVAAGAEIDNLNESGTTPLFRAAEAGRLEVVKELLRLGSTSINTPFSTGTAIQIAHQMGHREVVRELARHGAHLGAFGSVGETQMHLAAFLGDTDQVRIFHEAGHEIDERSTSGITPLLIASGQGHEVTVRELLRLGASVKVTDAHGRTALHAAANNGHVEVVKELLQHGAHVEDRDRRGKTALQLAAKHGRVEVVIQLLSGPVNVGAECYGSKTALHLAAKKGHLEVVKQLVAKGVNVNANNSFHQTPLHLAASKGHAEVVRELMQHKANVEATDVNGHNALFLASTNGHSKTMKVLKKKKKRPSSLIEVLPSFLASGMASKSTFGL